MRITRGTRMAALAAVGILALAACSESGDSTGAATDGAEPTIDCATGTLSGEGSSFQKNAIEQWRKLYQEQCPGATVNYTASGSGAGVSQFLAGQVDWGGSDSALKDDEPARAIERCDDNPAWNLPMVGGAVAIAFNADGVDSIVLDPETAASIFLGQIKTWDDPAIAALNEGVELPDNRITVFYRADESGTTDNFTRFLNTAAPEVWTAEPGKAWPKGATGEGKPQNAGILDAVLSTPYSISYLDYSDLLAGGLKAAAIDTGNGPVELTPETASAGLASAQIVGEGNDLILELDYGTTEAGAYPAVAVAYEIVCSAGLSESQAALVKSFFTYTASPEGQAVLPTIGYVQLPESIETKVEEAVAALS